VQKRLNQSRNRLEVVLGEPKQTRWDAHWRHLLNAIKPYMRGGDAL